MVSLKQTEASKGRANSRPQNLFKFHPENSPFGKYPLGTALLSLKVQFAVHLLAGHVYISVELSCCVTLHDAAGIVVAANARSAEFCTTFSLATLCGLRCPHHRQKFRL